MLHSLLDQFKMPKIFIKRNSEYANKFRTFDLYLNGTKVSEINDAQLITLDIPEGKYILEARIDWCSSQPLTLQLSENDQRKIEVNGFIFSKYFLPAGVFVALLYFAIYFKYGINSLFLGTLLMFFMGYLLFFLSFGRKHYLRLTEK